MGLVYIACVALLKFERLTNQTERWHSMQVDSDYSQLNAADAIEGLVVHLSNRYLKASLFLVLPGRSLCSTLSLLHRVVRRANAAVDLKVSWLQVHGLSSFYVWLIISLRHLFLVSVLV